MSVSMIMGHIITKEEIQLSTDDVSLTLKFKIFGRRLNAIDRENDKNLNVPYQYWYWMDTRKSKLGNDKSNKIKFVRTAQLNHICG